ncbi:MAG: envelope stress sensor histidine kinase CpxA [Haemophilus parainfluenzae]|nr:envelope stress sensor histidine kinase CpxA [Haemophilus parainfluenzae]MDU4896269.1 envelope stress sensor histidine kinase CpxA [Haemophilus parainfluenzae]
MRVKKFSLDQLTIRTFIVFWLAFFTMAALLVVLPHYDSRLYSDLNQNDISNYQKKLFESIRNNKISSILAGVPVLPVDKFDSYRPVIMTPEQEILGALDKEKRFITRFAQEANDFSTPQRRVFNDIEIAGPFKFYIGDSETTSKLFFVSRANNQQEILRYMLDHPWILLLLTLIITTPLLWWFTHTIVKPITNLQKAANSVTLGNFKVDNELANHGPSELREVGQSFNKMSIAINNLISNQHNLLSSISHELKTPLTRLQLSTALVRHQTGDIEPVKRIEKEIQRMDKMISELLLISHQQMHSQMEHNLFSIDQLWDDVIKDALFEAEQRKITCDVNISILHPEKHMIYGNLSLLTSAIENIVRNALKYTKDRIFLTINLQKNEQDEKCLQIRVDDNGLGLPPEEFDKIFKPFYRVDETRTRATGGTGLGLTIVYNVVNEHNGKVWAESSNLGGLAVTIQLPVWKQS